MAYAFIFILGVLAGWVTMLAGLVLGLVLALRSIDKN